ncbi:hypothetical protein EZV76_03290 [Flagellimonas alvinocaridis]|uniref:DinB family protein n=1 Tax=Flagellimonas alvinocaridis TaxID=2530200 RepID=A0A4V4HXK3_9FLAO|nr:hypothetical protein [Allomuricauda alvinocaridis]THV61366.1 hypothetical protein EZV76_03290 [Allomuricauda alvinocaridis]
MAQLLLTPENHIQRLNAILNKVDQLQNLGLPSLTTPPNSKSWNILEVLVHLNIAYGHYQQKFNQHIPKLPDNKSENEGFRIRRWQKLVVDSQRPKEGVRKWKMKTLKKFEPLLDHNQLNHEKAEEIFKTFFELHNHLKEAVLLCRKKEVSQLKIPSAIGPIVLFYLPEAFEFLICHLERHMVQIDEILQQQDSLVSP